MEWILPDIAVEVSLYLPLRDISASCAVSTHWRQAFGSDQVWRRWCDPDLEEHLRTTSCVVQPAFSVPGERGSTLAPISKWRAAFLREQHLWSNWLNGKYKKVTQEVAKTKKYCDKFITNDFLVSFYEDSFELWDVRVIPMVCVDRLVLEDGYSDADVFNNGFVVVDYALFTRIFKIDVIAKTITTKYQLLYNDIERIPVLMGISEQWVSGEPYFSLPEIVITTSGKCIIYSMMYIYEDKLFHVMDLDSGVNLKDEHYPSDSCCSWFKIAGSKASDNVLVMLGEPVSPQLDKRRIECRVYNVEKLTFLPFHQIVHIHNKIWLHCNNLCAITEKFVALSDYENAHVKTVRIFNYQTGHQLHQLKLRSFSQLDFIDGKCLAFVRYTSSLDSGAEVKSLMLESHPSPSLRRHMYRFMKYSFPLSPGDLLIWGRRTTHLGLQPSLCFAECPGEIVQGRVGVKLFGVVGKQIVETCDSDASISILKIRRSSVFKTAVLLPELQLKKTNQGGTRLVGEVAKHRDRGHITILHFW